MKVVRRREEAGEAAAAAKPAAAAAAPKVLVRAAAGPKITKEEEDSQKVAVLLRKLSLADGGADVAKAVQASSFGALQAEGLVSKLREAIEGSDLDAREAALLAVAQLPAAAGRAAEPHLLPLVPLLLERANDKAGPARDAAVAAAVAVGRSLCPYAAGMVLPVVFAHTDPLKKWQTREAALKMLSAVAEAAPAQVAARLPEIVPLIAGLMVDPREQVKAAAVDAGTASYHLVGNRDIEHLVDDLLHCVARPEEVSDVVVKLSATTFVQAIEAPALAVMVPLLVRGLRESTAIQRKCCVIITNMAKLVNSPLDAAHFLPALVPGVEKVARAAADPELRDVASSALVVLERIVKEASAMHKETKAAAADPDATARALSGALSIAQQPLAVDAATLSHVAALCAVLMDARVLGFEEWRDCIVPYLAPGFMEEAAAEAACRAFMAQCMAKMREEGAIEDLGWDNEGDDDKYAELCNCRFSLAYGGKILLNNAALRLLRGRRYGLCGANGAGKSTLMRAISRGQLDGFPPPHVLKTLYVEHDIQASLADLSVVDYVAADPEVQKTGKTPADVAAGLASVGFDEEMMAKPITGISGGWKMKLALTRAMLLGADILLLDEPTNHLDTTNVAWLERWLVEQKDVTVMTVSHDSGFLDNVCTDIIHYQNRQLRRYRGNLSEFVKAVPAAQSYYQLEAASLRFRFPTPGILDGISSKEKPIIKLDKVSFTYPGAPRPQLSDVHVMCRLSSRVAVLGANGAGKSTLIKVYGIGTDREEDSKVDRALEEEDKKRMAEATWEFDGQIRRFNIIVGRRKKKKDFEYEVQWQGLSSIKFNRWIPRAELVDKGFAKKVNEFDQKKAAAALGSDSRPLTRANVEKFLSDFGLESEFSCHSNIRGLSGGQKVKLVLAAAMWNSPHLLIMDEPTNYLDRESLGALATAIREFEGGVVLISHNAEFTSTCCSETWRVGDGRVDVVSAYEQRQRDAAEGGGQPA
ncbi:elongation factor EF-3 [Raphidocelis subcapitata]|uniref:Elongation factor EF-3 n=1 Tax=Raphidocelis subcapitata TaxID=307507 RepID=A0A2V0NYJ8_9CHLO|nr:elongation factor EF-3 [Raphidocelis subcapitata]|eukprot:GBF90643.1 elongation factor EF-3 [Raphidocelis subcapitata]